MSTAAQVHDRRTADSPIKSSATVCLNQPLRRLAKCHLAWRRLSRSECRYGLEFQGEHLAELRSERFPSRSAQSEIQFYNQTFRIRPDSEGSSPSQTTISIEENDQLVGTYKPSRKAFLWSFGELHLAGGAVVEWSQWDLVYKYGVFRSPSGRIILTYKSLFQNLFSSLKPWKEPGQLTIYHPAASLDLALILAVGWHLMVHC